MSDGMFLQHWQRVTRNRDGRTGVIRDIDGLFCNVCWDDDRTLSWEPGNELTGGALAEPGLC